MIARRALLAGLLAAGAAPAVLAQVQPRLDDPFNPALFEPRDLRVLQAALTLTGDYTALLDGAWGRGSAGALAAHAQRRRGSGQVRMADLLPLLRDWEAERRASGWLGISLPDLGLSLVVPALLARARQIDDGWRDAVYWRADDDSLQIAAGRLPDELRHRLHRLVRAGHDGGEPQYVLRRDDLWVTGHLRHDGWRAYIRTDNDDAVSMLARAAAPHRYRLALIAASYSRTPSPDLSPTPRQLLAALTEAAMR